MTFERLELIPVIGWDNAQSGYGFLEFGFGRRATGGIDHTAPYCQNFDVLAHELGHNILFSEVGVPDSGRETGEYGGFHESGGDLTALVACLHFNSVIDHLLENSSGNLFTVNELDRLGELPDGREIRVRSPCVCSSSAASACASHAGAAAALACGVHADPDRARTCAREVMATGFLLRARTAGAVFVPPCWRTRRSA